MHNIIPLLVLILGTVAIVGIMISASSERSLKLRWQPWIVNEGMARCRNCNMIICGCAHTRGVPSTWEDLNGSHFCPDGKEHWHA